MSRAELLEHCYDAGICPTCGDSWVDGACRCLADAELLEEADAHGAGCCCCLQLDDDPIP